MTTKTETRAKEKERTQREITAQTQPSRAIQVQEEKKSSLPRLSVGGSFSLFLADYKAANSK